VYPTLWEPVTPHLEIRVTHSDPYMATYHGLSEMWN